MISLICGIKKNKLVNIKINRLTDIENKLVVTSGEGERGNTGVGWGVVGGTNYWDRLKDVLYNTGNTANIL